MSDDAEVTYSVKEVLADIRDEMRRMLDVIAGKADRSEVTATHKRVDALELRVDVVEAHVEYQKRTDAETKTRRAWLTPAIISALGVLAAAALVLTSVLH